MSSPVVTIGPEESVETAARRMLDRDIGSLAVVDAAGKVVGVLTEKEFMAERHAVPFSILLLPRLFGEWLDASGVERVYAKARSIPVAEIMRRDIVTAAPGEPISPVVEKMLDRQTNHILVLEGGRPVGVIARRDVLRMAAGRG